jgi:hypothetical protein
LEPTVSVTAGFAARGVSAIAGTGSGGAIFATAVGSSDGDTAITAGASTGGGDAVASAGSARGAACSDTEAVAASDSGGVVFARGSDCAGGFLSVFALEGAAFGLASRLRLDFWLWSRLRFPITCWRRCFTRDPATKGPGAGATGAATAALAITGSFGASNGIARDSGATASGGTSGDLQIPPLESSLVPREDDARKPRALPTKGEGQQQRVAQQREQHRIRQAMAVRVASP